MLNLRINKVTYDLTEECQVREEISEGERRLFLVGVVSVQSLPTARSPFFRGDANLALVCLTAGACSSLTLHPSKMVAREVTF